jgi:nucleotidyltransferase substrate binding protein (TIGR01987 family)
MNEESEKVVRSLENFNKALTTLESFLAEPVVNERDRAGIIQAFEFCYELSWKSIKKFSEYSGLNVTTPLESFKVAFQIGLIDETEQTLWLDMKSARNLTSHTYHEELAEEVLKAVKDKYFPAMKKVFRALSLRMER